MTDEHLTLTVCPTCGSDVNLHVVLASFYYQVVAENQELTQRIRRLEQEPAAQEIVIG